MTAQLTKEEFLRIAAAAKAKREAAAQPTTAQTMPETMSAAQPGAFTWNEEQLQAINYGRELRGFCLIGAAGTGKTTCTQEVVTGLVNESLYTISKATKNLRVGNAAVAIVSYTNRAVANIKRVIERKLPRLASHCCTIHSLLEFAPVFYEIPDPVTGMFKKTMRFEPTYTADNPLSELRYIVVEESSMVSVQLFKLLSDACPNAEFIFLGDLNQIPPVFGDAILGYKLTELPVVELHRVYRQAMQSPIVAFQHNYTLKGKLPSDTELDQLTAAGNGIRFVPLKQYIEDSDIVCRGFVQWIQRQQAAGQYDPQQDVILIPYNKKFGTVGVNKEIAQFLGDQRQATVWEVIAGRETLYLAVGDQVTFAKEEWTITDIKPNRSYFGKPARQPSQGLNRWGGYKDGYASTDWLDAQASTPDTAAIFDSLLSEEGDVTKQASHIISLASKHNPEVTRTIDTLGEINSLDFSYALTIHKAQGSEWRRVYLVCTRHHAPMLNRELLYTGMTRAREELVVLYSPQSRLGKKDNSIAKAIGRQYIPGNTWKAKVEHFKGRIDGYNAVMESEVNYEL